MHFRRPTRKGAILSIPHEAALTVPFNAWGSELLFVYQQALYHAIKKRVYRVNLRRHLELEDLVVHWQWVLASSQGRQEAFLHNMLELPTKARWNGFLTSALKRARVQGRKHANPHPQGPPLRPRSLAGR